MTIRVITYSTGNKFKQEEGRKIIETMTVPLNAGGIASLRDHFLFDFNRVPTTEPMERDMVKMVEEKSKSAYRGLMLPCIVEYAGLIFVDCLHDHFPGGLTQSVWSALGPDRFVQEFGQARPVIARAVVGYCNGKTVKTFFADTLGTIADRPRGSRVYDWDIVFCPDGEAGLTYSEIVEDPSKGIEHKVRISQSTKAFMQYFRYMLEEGAADNFFE